MADRERRPRVLIADDDERFASTLAALLEADGRVEVIGIAGNGEEAVQLACWQDPDIVLMDVRMPRLDGVEATRLVRQSKPRLCILMVSGSGTDLIEQQAREAGAAGFMHKSRLPTELVDVMLELSGQDGRFEAAG